MGLGGISIWQLVIVLAIVLLLFGSKKLRNIGSDLGSAVKGFKKSVSDSASDTPQSIEQQDAAFTANEAQAEDNSAANVEAEADTDKANK